MAEGTIKKLTDKGFGFIKTDSGGGGKGVIAIQYHEMLIRTISSN